MDDETHLNEATEEKSPEEENKNAISSDLIRGHINTIILRTLYERDKYGYEIIEEIEKKSHGQYTLKQPTLYSALKRLESQGYINAYWKTDEISLGGRRKYYTLTDSGREITEKNQSEWEYSRTVIDNLISDRSFDFSQPAPTSVDFNILKKSTSRVPVVKDTHENDDDENEDDDKDIGEEQLETEIAAEEIKYETVSDQTVYIDPIPAPIHKAETVEPEISEQAHINEVSTVGTVVEENEPIKTDESSDTDAEQRRILHENYLKLISEPIEKEIVHENNEVPAAENIDTEKLIYNNKPETERDYRNLINNLFVKTVTRNPQPQIPEPAPEPIPQPTVKTVKEVRLDDVNVKAENDGLKVNSSDYVITGSRKKNYNRGNTLLKCSLIIAIVMLLEFTLTLLFKNEMGITLAYPFIILALAVAQLLIFVVLNYTDFGRNTRKPVSAFYLSTCIVLTIIFIFIIFIVSLLLGVNFASAGDVMAKLVVPSIIALNIPAFAVLFYLFSK